MSEPHSPIRGLLRDPFVRAACWLAALSVLVWPVAVAFGLTTRPDFLPAGFGYATYFEAINWWPYPIFFLAIIPLLYLTWDPFLAAWRDLARTGVLTTPQGAPSPAEATAAVVTAIRRRRGWAAVAALVATTLINAVDLREPFAVTFGTATGAEQLTFACDEPDAWMTWILEANAADAQTREDELCPEEPSPDLARIEPPLQAAMFSVLTWLQQITLVFLVAVAMAQLLLHACVFALFERLLPEAAAHGLRLRLNAASPVGEFGLEHWNYALNNFYWAACPALLGVFLSRAANDPEAYDPGQRMFGWIVPALLLAPAVLTIISRQSRLPEVWPELTDEASRENYQRQQLWPLERNWSSKLGIILAFVLAALALGHEMNRLLILT